MALFSTVANAGMYEKEVNRQNTCKGYGETAGSVFQIKARDSKYDPNKMAEYKNGDPNRLIIRVINAGMVATSYENAYTVGWAKCMDYYK